MAGDNPITAAKLKEGETAPALAKELIDVLMRGLNEAKQTLTPEIIAAGSLCTGYYADSGPPPRQCMLWYSHQ